jgi:hypothetical protein
MDLSKINSRLDGRQVLRCVVAHAQDLPLHYERLVEIGALSLEHHME